MALPSSCRTYNLSVLLVLFGYFCSTVVSFIILQQPIGTGATSHIGRPRRTLPTNLRSTAGDEEEKTSSNKETLVFRGDLNLSSEPLPKSTAKADVASFLLRPEIRNSLLSSGGTRPVEEVPRNPELDELWIKFCNKEYGAQHKPQPGDSILACDTVIKFPGLKMVNRVFNGVKCSVDPDSGIPTYSFFLIGERQSVTGLPPVVFVFNKLTGADKKGDSLEPSGVAKSTLSVKENTDGNMVFNFVADIQIKIEFPALLLKILPTTKEKAEAQGSKSILKAIYKAVDDSTKSLYDAFIHGQSTK